MINAVLIYLAIGFVFAVFYRICQEMENDINRHVNRNAFVIAWIFLWPFIGFCGAIAFIVYVFTGEQVFKFKTGWDG